MVLSRKPWQQLCHNLAKANDMRKINISDEIAALDAYWSQKVIAEANGQLFKVAKGIGEINWHKHDDQDELFILYKGHLIIQLATGNIELAEGEMFVIPKGVEHCAKAEEEAAFVIVGLNITSNKSGGKPDWSYPKPQ
jgi:quercetin dioxygenase-like cupin family protein